MAAAPLPLDEKNWTIAADLEQNGRVACKTNQKTLRIFLGCA
jgi:hypothetical protein